MAFKLFLRVVHEPLLKDPDIQHESKNGQNEDPAHPDHECLEQASPQLGLVLAADYANYADGRAQRCSRSDERLRAHPRNSRNPRRKSPSRRRGYSWLAGGSGAFPSRTKTSNLGGTGVPALPGPAFAPVGTVPTPPINATYCWPSS